MTFYDGFPQNMNNTGSEIADRSRRIAMHLAADEKSLDRQVPLAARTLCWKPKKHNKNVSGKDGTANVVTTPTEEEYNNFDNYDKWCLDWINCVDENATRQCSPEPEFKAGGEDNCAKSVQRAW